MSGPPSVSGSASATFDFASSEAGSSFECSVDGGAFVACSDPATFGGLSEGSHTVAVRARDAVGNVDASPATYAWTIDLSAPETTIVSGPPALTNQTQAAFDFASNESPVSYECSLDAGPFVPCTDPQTFAGLDDGSHTLAVRAVDAAGNRDATPATYAWEQDSLAPGLPIVLAPVGGTTLATVPVVLSGTAEAGSTVTITIDGQVVGTATVDANGSWTFDAGPLADGPHAAEVTSTDAAGNASAPAQVSFTVDTTPPETAITSAPSGTVSTASAAIAFGSHRPDRDLRVQPRRRPVRRLHRAGLALRALRRRARVPRPRDRPVRPRRRDARRGAWTVDTGAPETAITSAPGGNTFSTTAVLAFTSPDATATFECSLDGAAFAACTSAQSYSAPRRSAPTPSRCARSTPPATSTRPPRPRPGPSRRTATATG